MQKWEYLFISCSHHNGDWRPQYANGHELPDWKRGPTISTYSNQLGTEGWELINLMTGHNQYGATDAYRLVFKRPKQ